MVLVGLELQCNEIVFVASLYYMYLFHARTIHHFDVCCLINSSIAMRQTLLIELIRNASLLEADLAYLEPIDAEQSWTNIHFISNTICYRGLKFSAPLAATSMESGYSRQNRSWKPAFAVQ